MAVKNAIKGYEEFVEEYEKEMEETMEYDQDKIYEDEIEEENQTSQVPEIQMGKKREFMKVMCTYIFSHYLYFPNL